jgi:hypothetical protein
MWRYQVRLLRGDITYIRDMLAFDWQIDRQALD